MIPRLTTKVPSTRDQLRTPRGFTLIELIIVVSIIAVLSSIAYISLSGETANARDSSRRADLKTLESAVAMSNAQNKTVTYLTPSITTGTTGADAIITTKGAVRVLRNAQAFQIGSGFINSTILGTISRDPFGAPYLAAFINQNQFQLAGVLENPTTKIPETILVGSFKKDAIIDNVLVAIDNDDRIIPVGNAGQFIRGDVIQIDDEKMVITDVSSDDGLGTGDQSALIVTRGYSSTTATVHQNRSYVKITSLPSNASSLFCLGDLTTLAKSAANANVLAAPIVSNEIPSGWSVTLANISLEDTYTCSASGDVFDGGAVILYEVVL